MRPEERWILLSPPDVGPDERAALLEAFDSGWIAPAGPAVESFEAEIERAIGRHVALVASGTAALHLALLLARISSGDEVIVPSLTFAASAFPVNYVRAAPWFVDVSADHWTIDPDAVEQVCEQCISAGRPLPKAVVAVDLYGQCADYDRLEQLARHYKFTLIADAAESLGAFHGGRPAGSIGDFAIISFNGNKIITSAGGGALAGTRLDQIELGRKLANQAREPVAHYEHNEIGYNYRISSFQASVGSAQLRRLSEFVRRRRSIYEYYHRELSGLGWLELMPRDVFGTSNCWLTCGLLSKGIDPERVIRHLSANQIEARRVWKPLHLQSAFAGATAGRLPVSEDIFNRGICLPSGSRMTADDLQRVLNALTALPI